MEETSQVLAEVCWLGHSIQAQPRRREGCMGNFVRKALFWPKVWLSLEASGACKFGQCFNLWFWHMNSKIRALHVQTCGKFRVKTSKLLSHSKRWKNGRETWMSWEKDRSKLKTMTETSQSQILCMFTDIINDNHCFLPYDQLSGIRWRAGSWGPGGGTAAVAERETNGLRLIKHYGEKKTFWNIGRL